MKATCYVTFIAIVIVDVIWVLFGKEAVVAKVKQLLLRISLVVCGFLLASLCKSGMYQTLDYEYNRDMEIGWTTFLYDGLDEETTGACSTGGLDMVRDHVGESREAREAFELERVIGRIKEKGFAGLMDFWLRKQVMTYNDGTFSWFQEGFFHAWDYEDITDSSWQEPLRDFYWSDGEKYPHFVTISHGIWLFILVGVLCEAFMVLLHVILNRKAELTAQEKDSGELTIRTMAILNFIGVFLFLMLFEGRARYLYNSIAVFSMMAVWGYCKFVDLLLSMKQQYFKRKS